MQQFAVSCGCGRSMSPYGRAGRNAFRCGCGSRVQVIASPVTTRTCSFGDCRTLATTKEPLRFCLDHEEQASVLLAHIAGVAKVRELETNLTRSVTTWARKYGYRVQPIPQNTQHAPIIYFARRERLIKIGTTTNLPQRMMSLHAQDLATEPGDIVREGQLHRRFQHLRASGRGREWFHPGPDLIAYINELRAASGIQSVDSPAPPVGHCVELESYLAETTDYHAPRTLTQGGESLAGRVKPEKLARSPRRQQVHVAVTGTWPTRKTAVAACFQSKEIGTGAGGLVPASSVPGDDRCNRLPCRARWESLDD
ncbi:GIY-YIG nuclease family protein [Streptomyces sp. NPDC006551]|uniref:GIY-YIG nuclease family protein n=1 Tax=Streptomyces sp. NPDC006551 TaxID=3157178 RepID=UPI0033BB7A3B